LRSWLRAWNLPIFPLRAGKVSWTSSRSRSPPSSGERPGSPSPLQLGVVDPIASLVYRFGLASALLFAWCALRGERLALTPAQHRAAAGPFTFAIDYSFTYWAEALVVWAVVRSCSHRWPSSTSSCSD
jgi:hypothetical protein